MKLLRSKIQFLLLFLLLFVNATTTLHATESGSGCLSSIVHSNSSELKGNSGTEYSLTKKMNPRNVGEHVRTDLDRRVTYISNKERHKYEVFVNRNGLLVDYKGKVIDTSDATVNAHEKEGYAIFVMAPNGRIYISKTQKLNQFHHSSLVEGRPVAAAGEIWIENGKVYSITDQSGHYHPTNEMTDQFVQELTRRGAEVLPDTLDYFTF